MTRLSFMNGLLNGGLKMKEALRNLQISENRKSVKCLILLISMMSLLLLGVTGCSQSDFPLAEDFLLSMIQEKIENFC